MKFSSKLVLCAIVFLGGARLLAMGTAGVQAPAAESEDCVICQEPLSEHTAHGSRVHGADVFDCPAGSHHDFHDACLARWIDQQVEQGTDVRCPICRAQLRSELASADVAPLTRAAFERAQNDDASDASSDSGDSDVSDDEQEEPQDPLDTAVIDGNTDAVRALLVEPGITTDRLNGAVALAFFYHHPDLVRVLLHHPAADAGFALYRAVEAKNLDLVREILARPGVNVNGRFIDGNTPLIEATQNRDLGILRELLKRSDIDVNARKSNGATALMEAILHNNAGAFQELFKHGGVDKSVRDNDGATTIMYAASHASADVLNELLRIGGVDVNAKTKSGQTALMFAVIRDNGEPLVRILLEQPGIDPWAVDVHGLRARNYAHADTPADRMIEDYMRVHEAGHGVSVAPSARPPSPAKVHAAGPIARVVLAAPVRPAVGQAGPSREVRSVQPVAPVAPMPAADERPALEIRREMLQQKAKELCKAALFSRIDEVKNLLSIPAIDVNVRCHDDGSTPLMLAATAFGGKGLGVAQALLAHPGIDVNARCNDGATALMRAIEQRNNDIALALLSHSGVEVNNKGGALGWTPLIAAAAHNLDDVVRQLLQYPGIDVRAQVGDGRTALNTARQGSKSAELIQQYLDSHAAGGAAVPSSVTVLPAHAAVVVGDIIPRHNFAKLYLAINKGALDEAKALLADPKTDINAQNNMGQSVLWLAVARDRREAVAELLKLRSINPNAVTNTGETPLMEAASRDAVELVKMLLGHPGIDVRVQNKDGRTALDLARRASKSAELIQQYVDEHPVV